MPKFTKYDKDGDTGYACGLFPSIELAKRRPGAVRALLIQPGTRETEGFARLAGLLPADIYIEEAPRAIERISGKESCRVIAVFEKYGQALDASRPHIVLHNISDMGNLGAIARTCLGFDYDQAALIRPCADPFDPRCVRASMGALFGVNIALFDSYEAYESLFPKHTPYFFRLTNARDLFTVKPTGLPALVFGNEGAGLPEPLCARGTGVRIPHNQQIDSLNLAVAVGIGVSYFAAAIGLSADKF